MKKTAEQYFPTVPNDVIWTEADFSLAKEILVPRQSFSHKGTYGKAVVLGGCISYTGAPKLANSSLCALKVGAGLSCLAVPKSIALSCAEYVLESTLFPLSDREGNFLFLCEEIDRLSESASCLALGMGMGQDGENEKLLSYLLKEKELPLVIDADGLNSLAKMDLRLLKETKCQVVLTPHIKEFSRLLQKSVDEVAENPIGLAKAFAEEYAVVLVLKGTCTVITDGKDVVLSDSGCGGMAKGGSGDVLSGVLCGLIAQRNGKNLLSTVAGGVFLNGLAGELAEQSVGGISQTPSDTVKAIPRAVQMIEKK